MPSAPLLKSVRQEIDYNLQDFEGILKEKSFKKAFGELEGGDALQRPPKGYAPDNPAINYLKMTSITVGHPLKDEELMADDAAKNVTNLFVTMSPLVAFLNRPLA